MTICALRCNRPSPERPIRMEGFSLHAGICDQSFFSLSSTKRTSPQVMHPSTNRTEERSPYSQHIDAVVLVVW